MSHIGLRRLVAPGPAPEHGDGRVLEGLQGAPARCGSRDASWQSVIVLAELQSEIEAAVANVWWAFSSTSTSRTQAEIIHGREGERVLFIVRSGSARDVRRYSAIPAEDELLMPCV
jgi:hypothetical protein